MNEILWALAGGAIIGIAAALLFAMNGRTAGISGILGALVRRTKDGRAWRALFLAGLLVGGGAASLAMPWRFDASAAPALPWVALAGLLVGVGTQLGGGCTSGHGVCGVSRLSARSIVATLTFMATGIGTVFALKLMGVHA